VDRLLVLLSENSVKVLLLLLIVGGSVAWFAVSESDPVKALQGRCGELRLPVRSIQVASGSDEESKFLLMVPARQRERVRDGHWVFCRANLVIRPR
jgi:hypothetical protein